MIDEGKVFFIDVQMVGCLVLVIFKFVTCIIVSLGVSIETLPYLMVQSATMKRDSKETEFIEGGCMKF